MRIKEIWIDDSTKLSFSRIVITAIVLTYLVFAAYMVFSKGILPDIPLGAGGVISVLYGVNKLSPTIPFGGSK